MTKKTNPEFLSWYLKNRPEDVEKPIKSEVDPDNKISQSTWLRDYFQPFVLKKEQHQKQQKEFIQMCLDKLSAKETT